MSRKKKEFKKEDLEIMSKELEKTYKLIEAQNRYFNQVLIKLFGNKEDETMLTEEEKKMAEEFEQDLPDEILLIKEVDPERYILLIKKMIFYKKQYNLSKERMDKFVDLAADATGRPYIIDTGSNYDVADALFMMQDEWLCGKGKRTFWQVFRDVFLNLLCFLFAFSPVIGFCIAYWLNNGDPKTFIILGMLIPTFFISASFYAIRDRIRKNKRKH